MTQDTSFGLISRKSIVAFLVEYSAVLGTVLVAYCDVVYTDLLQDTLQSERHTLVAKKNKVILKKSD